MAHIVMVDSNAIGISLIPTAKRLGHEVSFMSSPAFAHFYQGRNAQAAVALADRLIQVEDSTDVSCVTRHFAALQRILPIDAAIAFWDATMLAAAKACSTLAVRFTSEKGVEQALRKDVTRSLLSEAGLESCRFGIATAKEEALHIAREIGFPVVFKPRVGYGKYMTELIDSETAIHRYFETFEAARQAMPQVNRSAIDQILLVEERVLGCMYSVEVGMVNSTMVPFMITQRKRAADNEILELGSTMPAPVSQAQASEILDYTEKVLRVIGLDLGIFHVELILSARGPCLIEVNPRLMGGALPNLYYHSTGDDIFEHLIAIHLGRMPHPARYDQARAATARIVGAKQGGRICDSLPNQWVSELSNLVIEQRIEVQAGQSIKRMVNNLSSLGYFQVVASTPAESVERADKVIDLIEARLGLELLR